MYQTTLTELIVLLSGAVVIATSFYMMGIGEGIRRERLKK